MTPYPFNLQIPQKLKEEMEIGLKFDHKSIGVLLHFAEIYSADKSRKVPLLREQRENWSLLSFFVCFLPPFHAWLQGGLVSISSIQ